ncbi:MAG: amidohydrolase family protein, partial [Emcibacteraceae bacterium]|nr:amidohydrolase family protein [Emcibacteraceae bacterium]
MIKAKFTSSAIMGVQRFSKAIATFVIVACLVSCGEQNITSENTIKADHVFTNGNVYTVDNAAPWAEAVAIKGDKIIFVGLEAEIENFIDAETVQHDLKGRLLLPGFIDSHTHSILGGGYVNALSLNSSGGPDELLIEIATYAENNKDMPVLFGFGHNASAFGPEGPTKEMLDGVVSDRPIFIMDEGFHSGWANSKTMELLGITKDTPDPAPGFDFYKRDEEG